MHYNYSKQCWIYRYRMVHAIFCIIASEVAGLDIYGRKIAKRFPIRDRIMSLRAEEAASKKMDCQGGVASCYWIIEEDFLFQTENTLKTLVAGARLCDEQWLKWSKGGPTA